MVLRKSTRMEYHLDPLYQRVFHRLHISINIYIKFRSQWFKDENNSQKRLLVADFVANIKPIKLNLQKQWCRMIYNLFKNIPIECILKYTKDLFSEVTLMMTSKPELNFQQMTLSTAWSFALTTPNTQIRKADKSNYNGFFCILSLQVYYARD